MLKLIQIDSSYYNDEPIISRIHVGDVSGLVKAAADAQVLDFTRKLPRGDGKVYLHIIAMGAADYWSSNKNGDAFPEAALRRYYKTFETTPAHVYRNHINKNPAIAMGKVILAVYNERMHRIELVCEVDPNKAEDLLERLDRGETIATSMATKTPSDRCSICGNRARSRSQYCTHLSNEMGMLYPDGRKVAAINDDELKFFDISWIMSGKQADPTSTVLQKIASEDRVIGSAELAEIEGLTEKSAAHKKLSQFIKEITGGMIVGASPNVEEILDKVKDPSDKLIEILSQFEVKPVLEALAHHGVSPSLGWLAELIAVKALGPQGIGLGRALDSYFDKEGFDVPVSDSGFGEPDGVSTSIARLLEPHVKEASLMPSYVADRIYYPGTNVGFTGNGPHIEPEPEEVQNNLYLQALQAPKKEGKLESLFHTLIAIGSVAMAAKWFITNTIAENAQNQENTYLPVKIGLVEKRALEYSSAHKLAESDMIRVVKRKSTTKGHLNK